METLTGLTRNYQQHMTLSVGNNEKCDFKIYFLPSQKSWYFDWEYNDISSKGNKMVLSYNILRYYRKRIPFGLMIFANDRIPPFKADDFINNRVKIVLLNTDDIELGETEVYSND